MKFNNPWLSLGILAVVLVGGSVAYSQFVNSRANQGVELVDHIKGNLEAEVRVVEYSDFECSACAAFFPIVNLLMDMYGDEISFEYKHFPVIENNPQVLLAAEAAGQQGMFFEYHNLLFENYSEWSRGGNVDRFLRQYAEDLSLDMNQWETQRRSSLLRNKIRDDYDEGVSMGVTVTPTFLINDEIITIENYQDLITAVEDVLGVESFGSDDLGAIEFDMDDVDIQMEDDNSGDLEIQNNSDIQSENTQDEPEVRFGF